ncbi:L-ascorbate metabolism protein UlaG (beta-lactamase superfamily) [Orenia metallireducens]|uniref:L-ascorbate metabolism protein UlaG, beta-lactamase superfamily n=1 Tax=Orenia metallireducens TaxID=1413210 RepID=A0A285H2E5_9FIRM|nr:MBL fold metallo-hydrolase [Orenia metallireducens]PRX29471.1 L-ascorbate metabolism protein UlaG (beta-lactamase superfamily) [Orenia metallireducens]SNY30070.1 L-ascorbate metabolism protein UlaG, beta-lactamase superfamily [Orenia metallireducens]
MAKEATIYHLYHSGVAIKTADHFLIFDYYNDTPNKGNRNIVNGVITNDILKREDNIIVFVTHNHHDHFNPIIFDWEKLNSDITYILSDDVEAEEEDNRYTMTKYQEINWENDIYIKAYGSTDQGLSYYVEVDGLKIFHAGDLSWWDWKRFTEEERKTEEEDYKEEIEKLTEKEVDLAFVPVDPRLEESYYLGGRYFAETIKPQMIVPIHFTHKYDITKKFAQELKDLQVDGAIIERRGEKIKFRKY